MGLLDRRERTL